MGPSGSRIKAEPRSFLPEGGGERCSHPVGSAAELLNAGLWGNIGAVKQFVNDNFAVSVFQESLYYMWYQSQ